MHYIAGICIYHRPQFRLFSLSSRTASYATSTSQDMSKETLKIRSPSPSPDTSITTIRYDLYRGHPNMKLLPQSEMKTIMSDMLDEDDDSWLRYLNYGANAGSKRFRASLRSFLQRRTKDDDMGDDIEHLSNNGRLENDDHELFITNGVSHGLVSQAGCQHRQVDGNAKLIKGLLVSIFLFMNYVYRALTTTRCMYAHVSGFHI